MLIQWIKLLRHLFIQVLNSSFQHTNVLTFEGVTQINEVERQETEIFPAPKRRVSRVQDSAPISGES